MDYESDNTSDYRWPTFESVLEEIRSSGLATLTPEPAPVAPSTNAASAAQNAPAPEPEPAHVDPFPAVAEEMFRTENPFEETSTFASDDLFATPPAFDDVEPFGLPGDAGTDTSFRFPAEVPLFDTAPVETPAFETPPFEPPVDTPPPTPSNVTSIREDADFSTPEDTIQWDSLASRQPDPIADDNVLVGSFNPEPQDDQLSELFALDAAFESEAEVVELHPPTAGINESTEGDEDLIPGAIRGLDEIFSGEELEPTDDVIPAEPPREEDPWAYMRPEETEDVSTGFWANRPKFFGGDERKKKRAERKFKETSDSKETSGKND